MPANPPADFNDIEENNYIGFPSVFPMLFTNQECSKIIDLSKNLETHQAPVGPSGTKNIDLSTRNSNIKWLGLASDTQWIYQRIQGAYTQANINYKFDLLGCSFFQVTEYPVGGKYDWHEDVGDKLISKRKLSLSVQLSDPNDYDGGDLEFLNPLPYKSDFRQQGSVIIFPSFLAHRVTAVTRGARWSLIAWVFGPPFR